MVELRAKSELDIIEAVGAGLTKPELDVVKAVETGLTKLELDIIEAMGTGFRDCFVVGSIKRDDAV